VVGPAACTLHCSRPRPVRRRPSVPAAPFIASGRRRSLIVYIRPKLGVLRHQHGWLSGYSDGLGGRADGQLWVDRHSRKRIHSHIFLVECFKTVCVTVTVYGPASAWDDIMSGFGRGAGGLDPGQGVRGGHRGAGHHRTGGSVTVPSIARPLSAPSARSDCEESKQREQEKPLRTAFVNVEPIASIV